MGHAIIQTVLQEANEAVFGPRSMCVKLVKDCPEMIPIVAQWLYDDWHSYDKSLTIEKLIKGLEKQLNARDMPFTLIVLKEGVPVGSISLRKEKEPEFSDIADKNPWAGTFHVIPSARNSDVGPKLKKVILTIAKRLGYQHVNFYTSNVSNVKNYVKMGAQVVGTRPFRGHTITLMKMDITE